MISGRRYGQGFTLIELLVALLIFVLLAVMSYGGLRTVLDSQQSFERHNDRLAELQILFMMMGRDIEQTVNRPVRDSFGDPAAALVGADQGLELTRAGRRNPGGMVRSQLQRVGWFLDNGELQRQTWAVLDRAQDSEPVTHVLAEQVRSMGLRFLDGQGQWHNAWPATTGNNNNKQPALPEAVEVNVELEDWGMVTRLFRVTPDRVVP